MNKTHVESVTIVADGDTVSQAYFMGHDILPINLESPLRDLHYRLQEDAFKFTVGPVY
jgi:hypothetical protein